MVDNPDRLRIICLRKFALILKSDQFIWKKHIEERVDKFYREENPHSTIDSLDQQKRKQQRSDSIRTDDDLSLQTITYPSNEIINNKNNNHQPRFYIEYFLHGYCPLNSILSEHLANYFVLHDQLNDFTLTLFSSQVTCLKKLVLNVKYLSRLPCHILNQHSKLIELEIIFKDSISNRTINDSFYQHICPSIHSNFDEIYAVYSPCILHHKYSRIQNESRRTSVSTTNLPNSSDEFSHHKLLNGIFNNLHPTAMERLKVLSISYYKFFTTPSPATAARKYSLADMSPSTKSSSNSASLITTPMNFLPTNLRLLLKFKNLTSLNLSATDIKNPYFDIIVDSLENLDTLDISSCRSIKLFHSLLKLSMKLKWLNLYNCCFHMQQNPTIYHILDQLKYLEYLDLSNDNTFNDNNNTIIDSESNLNKFLRQDYCLPRLKHFDISGLKTVSLLSLQKFLCIHPTLQFLGLFLTNEKYSSCLFDQNDPCYSKYRRYTYDLHHLSTVTLTEHDLIIYEPYLLETLTRYRDRSGFIQKSLSYIFLLTRLYQSKQFHLVIEFILQIMSIHSHSQAVQLAATACIYNLTRAPIIEQIHVKYLAQIAQEIMNVMATFSNQQQLQKNCLLALCSDRILHGPQFNFYLLAKLVMNSLQNYTDLALIQPGVAILSLLTTRLTIDECTKLGSIVHLTRLLQLIEQQVDRLQSLQNTESQPILVVHHEQSQQSSINDIDMTLTNSQQLTSDDTVRFCLSLLWNLTDENAIVCENFLQAMGLQLFQRLFHLFASDTIVLTKMVGLISNIAEVSHLKTYLYSIDMISLMQKYMTEGILDIAFSATGVLAHLICEQSDDEINFDLCQQMRETILSWRNPHTNMVTYRSFKPFIPLLSCNRIPVVQLWAIWAIHHVCNIDRTQYSRLIREEKIIEMMQTLYDNQSLSSDPDIAILQLLKSVLHIYKSSRHQNSSAVAS